MSDAKARVHQVLDQPEEGNTASKVVNGLLLAVIAVNVLVAILGTAQSFEDRFGDRFVYFDRASIAVFSFEYLLRVWSCTADDEYRSEIVKRMVVSYLTTLAVAMVLLILIETSPFDDLQLAFRRAVLIAFPASFAATAVDYIK